MPGLKRRSAEVQFSIQKEVSFFKVKKDKGLCEGADLYAAQATPQNDARSGEKSAF